MAFTLPPLDFDYAALEPFIDARTMEIHYTKHHQAYVNNLNAALEGYPALQKLTIEELLSNLERVPEKIRTAVRNHGGGHANHSFFWSILKKGTTFRGEIAEAIKHKFGGYDQFKEQFSRTAAGVFGSGWAWLVLDDGELEIMSTPNQDSRLSQGKTPIIGVDVWEHAYYLKYQNRRPEYLEAIFNVLDWEAINRVYVNAAKGVAVH